MRPYLVYSHEYKRTSAGHRALHRLCHLLNARGLDAWVASPVVNPEWGTPYADADLQNELARDGIVVYPEVDKGNPLGARRVVRYLLNQPGYIRGDTGFDPSELLFCYSELLRQYVPSDDRILTVPVIDTEIFNNRKSLPRSGSVYWLGRNKQAPVPFDSSGMRQITGDWPVTTAEVARLFQTSEVFYTFAVFTALVTEARLCGCPVRVVHDEQFSREEIVKATSHGGLGITWNDYDMEYARKTVFAFGLLYERYAKGFDRQLDTFIALSQRIE